MEKSLAERPAHVPVPDPIAQVEEVICLLDGARSQEGINPVARYESIEALERRAHDAVEGLTREYTGETEHLARTQEQRIWTTVMEYWRHLGAAYEDCFWQYQSGERGAGALKHRVPVIVCRALRALSAELKWSVMAYGPSDPTLWGRMGALYVIAEQARLEDEPCLVEEAGDETSIRQEYLRALMFAMAGVDTLTPLRIDVADRLTATFVSAFLMQTQPGKGCHYYIDLSAARAPARLVDRVQSPAPNPRFYGPGKAGAQAEKLAQLVLSRGSVPDDLRLPAHFDAELVVEALRHLARQWAALPPARGDERQVTTARLHLVHSFDTVAQAARALGRDATLDRHIETWTVRDASDSGFGAVLPETQHDWLRIGTLVATRLEGTLSWGVGVLRRINTTPQRQRLVGIQMLSRGCAPVELVAAEGDIGPESEGELALMLPSSSADSAGKDEIRLLLRSGSFFSHRPVRMVFHDRAYPLMPKQVLEAGRDFELVRFRVAGR